MMEPLHFNKNFTVQHKLFFTIALVGLLMFAPIGCSNPDAKYTKVEGTITYKGQPVDGATVTFRPVDSTGEVAGGKTDASGKFTLSSSAATKEGTGALPGEYVVLVMKREAQFDPNAEARQRDEDAYARGEITNEQLDARNRTRPALGPISVLPEKYNDPRAAVLKATVKQGKNDPFAFDLVD